MIKFEHTNVVGWEHAIRGMRNPMNSWDKGDSKWMFYGDSDKHLDELEDGDYTYQIGLNDINLMKRLRNAGTDHRKFMRMITVYVDITAPLYWWKEFDTYKVGTVANSCSTMHKLCAKKFELDDFSHECLKEGPLSLLITTIEELNIQRALCLSIESENFKPDKRSAWYQMIQLLPSSYNQKRTVMLNYEVLANIYKSRKNHKLNEWHDFCDWIEELPYSELITGKE